MIKLNFPSQRKELSANVKMKSTNVSKLIFIMRRHYKNCRAPVTRLGRDCGNTPFKTLIATILSSRTLDQTTTAVCQKLFRVVQTPADLKRISKKYWRELNGLFVAFGQTICRPLVPQCQKCSLRQYCRYANYGSG